MTQLLNRPASDIAADTSSVEILNNDPAFPAQGLDAVNINSVSLLAEKRRTILNVYKQICIGLAIYSSKEIEVIYRSLDNAKTISDIMVIQDSLHKKHEPRSADEKRFIHSWFNFNGLPLPGNDFAMPGICAKHSTSVMQIFSTVFDRFFHPPVYSV